MAPYIVASSPKTRQMLNAFKLLSAIGCLWVSAIFAKAILQDAFPDMEAKVVTQTLATVWAIYCLAGILIGYCFGIFARLKGFLIVAVGPLLVLAVFIILYGPTTVFSYDFKLAFWLLLIIVILMAPLALGWSFGASRQLAKLPGPKNQELSKRGGE